MVIRWDDLFKIRLSNIIDESMDKHDLIKTLLVRKILRKYRKRNWLRIYCEFKINDSGLRPDVYVENLREKSVVCYEIQKKVDEKYVKDRVERYNKVDVPYFKSVDLIIIPIQKLSNDISKLNLELEKYLV